MQFPFQIRKEADIDVVGFGTNAVDFLIRVPEYPEYNSKVELVDYVQAAGGEVATTMAGLQRLGLKTSYIGRFGDDQAGSFGLESLRHEGVRLEYAEQVTGAATQIAFIVIDVRSGERTVIWKRDARLAYGADEVPISAIANAKVLHFTPHDVDACLALAKEAKRLGVLVSADIDNRFDGDEELFGYVDIFIASADFPGKLFGAIDEREALREIHSRYGCGIVGITLGSSGSLLLAEGAFVETRGFEVPGGCKDTTGAGDSFRVGLLFGLLQGETVERAAEMANAVAALKCRAVGARTALPSFEELSTMLTNR
ncbi:MAG: carbohydrate kinase family protein [Pyrinomonadaceae bacterium]|nr:carbohydrate kinase family protein [Pyrinomonadaceae bacterium]